MSRPKSTPKSSPGPIRFHDRMAEADALIWNIESDPALRSTIVCCWLLDRAPDWDRFAATLARCASEIPRLRQRPVADPLGLAPPRWEDDPNFDLGFHVRRLAAPGEGTLRDLLDLAQPIGMQAFDRDRPLWELHIVEGLVGGRSGIIMKLHHAISDGVGLVRMTEGMIERSRDAVRSDSQPSPSTPPVAARSSWDRLTDALSYRASKRSAQTRQAARLLGNTMGRLLSSPVETLRELADQAGSIRRMLTPVTEPLSPLMRERSLSVHYAQVRMPLSELKRAANAVGCTLNDAFVAAVTGGLRRYHEALGAPVEMLRMNMPINTRSGEAAHDAGNQFAPVRFAVPISIVDPVERMQRLHELVAEQRAEPALPLMEPISAAIGSLPGGVPAAVGGAMMKAIDFTTSNVPGPPFPVYMAGAKVERMFGFGPLTGAAINVTCFSYNGDLGIGVNIDPAAVTDPALLVECLRKGFDEVTSVL